MELNDRLQNVRRIFHENLEFENDKHPLRNGTEYETRILKEGWLGWARRRSGQSAFDSFRSQDQAQAQLTSMPGYTDAEDYRTGYRAQPIPSVFRDT